MTRFEWTTEKPNQEGWYWRLCGPVASIVQVRHHPIRRDSTYENALCYVMRFDNCPAYIAPLDQVNNCLWAGPIPLPCEP